MYLLVKLNLSRISILTLQEMSNLSDTERFYIKKLYAISSEKVKIFKQILLIIIMTTNRYF